MAYALIYCRRIYSDILYHLYNIRLNKVEIVTYERLYELLHIESFINIQLEAGEDGGEVISGIEAYTKRLGKAVNTCIRQRDGKCFYVDSLGELHSIPTEAYLNLDNQEKAKFVNVTVEPRTKKLVTNFYLTKSSKLKREEVKYYINVVYITFTTDGDLVMLVNSGYCEYYKINLKIFRFSQKLYTSKGNEIEFDGVVDKPKFYLCIDARTKVEIEDVFVLETLTDYVRLNYKDFVQWDETNRVYCLGCDLSEEFKDKLKNTIKNS